jgi:hydrogenase maturation protease
MTSGLLVFGWGNLSRGDDALGPLFVQRLRGRTDGRTPGVRVEFLEDYQLQVEHALDLVGRDGVLFVDASRTCAEPFAVRALRPARDASFTTHAISPESVMQVYWELYQLPPPPCTLLAIRASRFDLGQPPGAAALENLDLAVQWGQSWISAQATCAAADSGCAHA